MSTAIIRFPMNTPKRLTKKQKDEQLAAQVPSLLQYHHLMLSDGVRNAMLYEAIKRNVNEDTSFLDIGAGTGVWAIVAAKLGAKRVVAVEIEEALIPIIYKHAQENGVAQKIEIIHANSDHAKIRGKFDVIVSELFGRDALGEATMKSFVSLRERFLAADGVLIPQKLTMLAAPVKIAKSVDSAPAGLDIKCEFVKSLKLHYQGTLSIDDRSSTKLLADPIPLVGVDFRTVTTAPGLANLSASWDMENLAEANAIAVFNHHTFTGDLLMDSFNSQSWGTTIYEFKPVNSPKGTLRFDITMDNQKTIWAITTTSSEETKTQNFSGAFSLARIRMAQQMTPHKRFKAPKTTPQEVKSKRKP